MFGQFVSWKQGQRVGVKSEKKLILHSAYLTVLPLYKLNETPQISIVLMALFQHYPPSHHSVQYEKQSTYHIYKYIYIYLTQTKSNQCEKACKSNRFGSQQHFIKTRGMNCSICVRVASDCSDLLL